MVSERLIPILLTFLTLWSVIAFFIIVILYIRVKQLTNDLRELKRRVEVTDEELYKLAEDIKEFKQLQLW